MPDLVRPYIAAQGEVQLLVQTPPPPANFLTAAAVSSSSALTSFLRPGLSVTLAVGHMRSLLLLALLFGLPHARGGPLEKWQLRNARPLAGTGLLAAKGVDLALARAGMQQQQASVLKTGRRDPQLSAAPSPDGPSQLQRTFASIYERRLWGAAGRGSGLGSSKEATVNTVAIVRLVMHVYNLHSLLDAPCGAMEWQPTLLEALQDDIADLQYLGVDVVPQVVQENQLRHASHINWRFEHLDITADDLPHGYDLILSRDALQHLSCELAVAALQRLAAAGSRMLLLGSYERSPSNVRVEVGSYFDVNLRQPPFSLAAGILHDWNEHTASLVGAGEPDKHLLLVSGAFLRAQDFGAMRRGCQLL